MKSIYLDYAATTPIDKRVLRAMQPYFSEKFGNAGSIHSYGQEAMKALDESRDKIANAIGAKFNEIIFTSSATEANNLALRGVISNFEFRMKFQNSKFKPKLIISEIEHESILETAKDLEKDGVEVAYLPVDKNGLVDLVELKKELNERTILVSVMYANNEIGTIQPIRDVAKIIREYKERAGSNSKFKIQNSKLSNGFPLLHTDAVQAFNYLDCNVDDLHVDMMTLSSHKIYGPKGAGALYIRNSKHEARNSKQIINSKLEIQNGNISDFGFRYSNLSLVKPMITGGGQEFGYRSSTENIPSIVGFAKAAEIASKDREKESKRIKELRDNLWKGIKKIFPKAQINGSAEYRLPNNLNVYLPGMGAEELLIKMDMVGIAISSGSACAARSFKPSHVIDALGFDSKRASQSVRITLGRYTDRKQIDKLLSEVLKYCKKLTK